MVVIGCAQLNRNTEERDRIFGKPRTADLKESGALEQDADCVALLWRPIMHANSFWQKTKLAYELKLEDSDNVPLYTLDKNGKLSSPQELSEEQIRVRDKILEGYAELIVVKQRDVYHTGSLLVTHRLQDAFTMASHYFDRKLNKMVPLEDGSSRNVHTNFLILRDHKIIFEGTAPELLRCHDQYIREYLS